MVLFVQLLSTYPKPVGFVLEIFLITPRHVLTQEDGKHF